MLEGPELFSLAELPAQSLRTRLKDSVESQAEVFGLFCQR